ARPTPTHCGTGWKPVPQWVGPIPSHGDGVGISSGVGLAALRPPPPGAVAVDPVRAGQPEATVVSDASLAPKVQPKGKKRAPETSAGEAQATRLLPQRPPSRWT